MKSPSGTRLPRAGAFAAVASLLLLPLALSGQATPSDLDFEAVTSLASPELNSRIAATESELRDTVARYREDRAALIRRYNVEYSSSRRERLRAFYSDWRDRLRAIDFEPLGVEGRIDAVLLENELRYQLHLLDEEAKRFAEMAPLIPFAARIMRLEESRRSREAVDPAAAAAELDEITKEVERARQALAQRSASSDATPSAIVAFRAAGTLADLRQTLGRWHRHYAGYDPLFTWWAADPYQRTDASLEAYASFVRQRLVGIGEDAEEPIIADPIGAEGMRADLAHEMIPYTPEELVAIAEREFAWLEAEARKASREMGFGDDWRAALEKVKTLHVPPGRQPELIRELAHEAEEFVESRELVTVPPLAKEVWRIEMMSPERQRVNPFFTGGEVISVSYPTEGMTHEEKLMSMRGNNIHFARATVHHELIPGHHLQGFMTARHNPYRQVFSTPFWGEGWALYWEMLLWDEGLPKTPEDRVGMLFWRMHRAARIIFSLNVHLGKMTPQEAIEFLVERVGHERANAEAEVRRSFNGSYPPLYQAAYMLGGLQFRAMYRELVDSGIMTAREFHDSILQGGRMPVEMVRARLTGARVPQDYRASWRFAGDR